MATRTAMSDQEYRQRFEKQLSGSVGRAKWIDSTSDHADHDGQTLATRNHDVIKQWAEERQAKPATIGGTEHDQHAGVLRFDFPGGKGGGRLQEIAWDQWFQAFDKRELVMLFQENLKNGNQSNFFKMNNPHREDG